MNSPSSDEVKAVRKNAGLTQAEAGRVVYVSERGWQNWELEGAKMPPGLYELFLLKTKQARKSSK